MRSVQVQQDQRVRIPSRRAIPALYGHEKTMVAVYEPIHTDVQQAELLIGNQFGLVQNFEVIERTKDVILVDIEPYVTQYHASDPVIPLVIKRTGFIYNFAIKRFTMVVARYNHGVRFSTEPSKWWYNAKARFWANIALSHVPLTDGQLNYYWYQLQKTINNPWRRR